MSASPKGMLIVGGVVGLLLLVGWMDSASRLEAQPYLCDDAQLTQSPGTPFSDSMWGTPGDDVIGSLFSGDHVSGLGGDDRICGGAGPDALFGGAGKDRLFGQSGNDFLFGAGGNDYLDGGLGNDLLIGSDGSGQNQVDTAFGGPGLDFCINIDMPFGAGGPYIQDYTGPC